MEDYYARKLSSERLRKVYDIAPLPVKRYLEAEIELLIERIRPDDLVLELGCGYGRILKGLSAWTHGIVGIDTAFDSLRMATYELGLKNRGRLFAMNALKLGFKSGTFHLTACMQNGISAFRVDPLDLMREAVRVTRPGGLVVFSSYAERFWPQRLEWFRLQAQNGLIGEIDEQKTGGGVIVCKDGFRATTISPEGFHKLVDELQMSARITEMDEGSVVCEIEVPRKE